MLEFQTAINFKVTRVKAVVCPQVKGECTSQAHLYDTVAFCTPASSIKRGSEGLVPQQLWIVTFNKQMPLCSHLEKFVDALGFDEAHLSISSNLSILFQTIFSIKTTYLFIYSNFIKDCLFGSIKNVITKTWDFNEDVLRRPNAWNKNLQLHITIHVVQTTMQ